MLTMPTEPRTRDDAPPATRPPARRRRVRQVARNLFIAAVVLGGIGVYLAVNDDPPTPPDVLLQQGVDAHRAGDLDEAAARYAEVLAVEPDNLRARYDLGVVLQTRGDVERAEAEYREALRIDAGFAPALFNLAVLRAGAGDHAAAVELYRLVLVSEPDNAGAHLNLGFALISVGEIEDGRTEIAKAAELDPSLVGADGAIEESNEPTADGE